MQSTKRNRGLRRLKRIGIGIVLALLALFATMQMPVVKDRLASALADRLSRSTGLAINIDGLRGVLPIRLRVSRIAVSDDRDRSIEIRELALRWPLGHALRGALHLESLDVGCISLNGIPASPEPSVSPGRTPLPVMAIRRLTVDRLELNPPLIATPVVLGISAAVHTDPASGRLSFEAGAAENSHLALQVEGWYRSATADMQLEMDARADRASALWNALGMRAGRDVSVHMALAGRNDQWSGTVQVSAPQLADMEAEYELAAGRIGSLAYTLNATGTVTVAKGAVGSPRVEALLGNHIAFHVRAARERGGGLLLHQADVSAAGHRLGAEGRYDPAQDLVEGEVRIAPGALKGLPSAMKAFLGESPEASARFSFLPNRSVVLSNAVVRVASFLFHGDGSYGFAGDTLAGVIRATSTDSSSLAAATEGALGGDLSVEGEISGTAERPVAGIVATWRDAVLQGEPLGDVHGSGTVSRVNRAVTGHGELALAWQGLPICLQSEFRIENETIKLPGVRLTAGKSTATGDLTCNWAARTIEGRVDLDLAGLEDVGQAFGQTVHGHGHAAVQFCPMDAGQMVDAGFALHEVARDQFEADAVAGRMVVRDAFRAPMFHWDVHIDDGRLIAGLRASATSVIGRAELSDVPLRAMARFGVPDLEGEVDAVIDLAGSPAEPILKGGLHARVARPSSPETEIDATVIYQAERLRTGLRLTTKRGDKLQCRVDLPLQFRIRPLTYAFDTQAVVTGALRGVVFLEQLNRLPVLLDQAIGGQANLDFTLQGSMADPRWGGTGTLYNVSYVNHRLGAGLHDIQGSIRAENREIHIREIAGRAGKNGRLAARGRITLDPRGNFPHTLELTLHDAPLLHTDLLEATAGGRLDLTGTTQSNRLAGTLAFVETTVNIPRQVLDTSSKFSISETDAAPYALPEPARATTSVPVALDLNLDFPNRLYVRGRGLQSEWGGSLTLQGTATKPVIAGTLKSRRGRFAFFGQNLRLAESTIVFDGSTPPSPRLDVRAVRERADIVATLRLAGPLTTPAISMSSVPDYPMEEILTRVLFGKQVSSISPVQALTMARAAYALESGGSAFDFMGLARKVLPVDQLDVREDENPEGVAEVSAGKYLSDRVFLQGETAIGRSESRLLLEVEVTPRVSVESDVGSDLRRGIGVNWKRDF